VDFERTPESTFEKDEKQVSFASYYKEKYNLTISQPDQPLLLHKDEKTNRETYLIPEFCAMTGLTDAMRANFRLMKDLGAITHSDAQRKVQECRNLFEVFSKNEKCVKKMEEWQLKFKDAPAAIEGYKFNAGKILMGSKNSGDRVQFDIETSGRDMDRKVQDKMYEQPEFKTWGIFYPERDEKVAKDFYNTIEKSLSQFGFSYAKPALFKLQGNPQRFETWEKSLKANLRPGVQAIVMLMPGQKSKCPVYDDLKRTLLSDLPVVSQGVLINTIAKGKNLRSIVNSILIQMCAKIGGVPWAVDQLPFMTEPTMVCGLDVFHSTALGKKSVMGFCASSNPTATQYWSTSKVHNDIGEEMSKELGTVMTKAIENFKKANGGNPPKNIILYRDGVGEGQTRAVCTVEMEQINAAIAATGAESKVVYLNVNKRINTRIFAGGDQANTFKNPLPGTVIDQGITERDMYEFFLVSTSAKQGLVAPTRYSILFDNTGKSPDQIELLTYKLCYTYYNVSGSIKVPAPIQYAHRLAALIGERGGRNVAPPKVHESYENKEGSLYFI
jgi:aubergine-like protein